MYRILIEIGNKLHFGYTVNKFHHHTILQKIKCIIKYIK